MPVDTSSGLTNDTIYLCNFRVSVDGDWLCLKELHDLQTCEFPSRSAFLREEYGINRNKNMFFFLKIYFLVVITWLFFFSERDPAQVERTNLVNLCKLIVKELIDSSVKYGRMLDSDFMPLQHFFIVLEVIVFFLITCLFFLIFSFFLYLARTSSWIKA